MHWFPKFTPAWNATCFGQFLCPSSGVYSLYTRHWYMSYSFEDSFRAGPGCNWAVPSWSCSKAVYKPVWHIPLLSLQWINSWWWTDELSETCRVSWQNKFMKLVHLVGFITKKVMNLLKVFAPSPVSCLSTDHLEYAAWTLAARIFPSKPDRLSKMSQYGTLCCVCHNLICPGLKDQFPNMCNS
jgi:hypothetical protein